MAVLTLAPGVTVVRYRLLVAGYARAPVRANHVHASTAGSTAVGVLGALVDICVWEARELIIRPHVRRVGSTTEAADINKACNRDRK